MVKHLDDHPLFERLTQAETDVDPCVRCVLEETEEGKKVARNNGSKYLMCYRRISAEHAKENLTTDWSGFKSLYSKDDAEDAEDKDLDEKEDEDEVNKRIKIQ